MGVSTFMGLQTALRGVLAHQQSIDTTSHNVANANTEGYSRQRVDFVSDAGPLTPAIHSQWNGTGQGVRSGSVGTQYSCCQPELSIRWRK